MIIRPGDLSVPALPADLFGREGPLVMEVGFGSGSFLQHLATEHPEWNLLGAEVSIGSVRRTFHRLRSASFNNVRLYPGKVEFLLRNILPQGSLHRLYVNFPDPWPKKRHRDRRLLQADFFELLSIRLGPEGQLSFTTDHTAYFQYAREQAECTGLYTITESRPPPAALQTKYARRWLELDKPIHHAVFLKLDASQSSFPPTLETYPPDAMHHAILEGDLPRVHSFSKQVHAFDGGHVILLEAARRIDREESLLIFGRIEEEKLIQDVVIEARPHERGVYVGIKPFGQPLATRGTREAVRLVTEWLVAEGLTPVVEAY